MDIDEFKALVGYTSEWDRFIEPEIYQFQLTEYLKGEDAYIDHYKWGAYRYILDKFDFSDPEVWKKFVILVDSDNDEHLFKGAISELLLKKILSADDLINCGSLRILSFFKVKQYIESYT